MLHPSTYSIVAYDARAHAWGVAVASKFPAVGAVVPWARAEAGALATQSYANTTYGPRGLDLLAGGASAAETLEQLLSEDEGREHRQVGIVDRRGGAVSFTGRECYEWAGGCAGEGYAIQGNILAGAPVIQAMEQHFVARPELPLAQRLYAALVGGEQAGGDRRGRQSAAIVVVKTGAGYGGFNDRWLDYRVDDHLDPLRQLGELLALHELYYGHSNPDERLLLRGAPLKRLQRVLQRLGYYAGPVNGIYSDATREGLRALVGNENFEERAGVEQGWIDEPVYAFLLRRFAD